MVQKIFTEQLTGSSLTLTSANGQSVALTASNTGSLVSGGVEVGSDQGPAVAVYSNSASFPLQDLVAGSMAFANNNNTLYLTNGSGWYKIALINQTPSINASIESATLGSTGNTVLFTYTTNEPEGTPVSVTISNSGISNTDVANIVHYTSNNTIEFNNFGTDGYSANVILTVSDGVNIGTDSVTVQVSFSTDFSFYFRPDGSAASFLGAEMTLDDSGNCYTTFGRYWNAAGSDSAIVLVKHDSSGNPQWAKSWYDATFIDNGNNIHGLHYKDNYLWLFASVAEDHPNGDYLNRNVIHVYKIDPLTGNFLTVWRIHPGASYENTQSSGVIKFVPMDAAGKFAFIQNVSTGGNRVGVITISGSTLTEDFTPKHFDANLSGSALYDCAYFKKGSTNYLAITAHMYDSAGDFYFWVVDLDNNAAFVDGYTFNETSGYQRGYSVAASSNNIIALCNDTTLASMPIYYYKYDDSVTPIDQARYGITGGNDLSTVTGSMAMDDQYCYSLVYNQTTATSHLLKFDHTSTDMSTFSCVDFPNTRQSIGGGQKIKVVGSKLLITGIYEDTFGMHSMKVDKSLSWVGNAFGANVTPTFANSNLTATTTAQSLTNLSSIPDDRNNSYTITIEDYPNANSRFTFANNTGLIVAPQPEWTP